MGDAKRLGKRNEYLRGTRNCRNEVRTRLNGQGWGRLQIRSQAVTKIMLEEQVNKVKKKIVVALKQRESARN